MVSRSNLSYEHMKGCLDGQSLTAVNSTDVLQYYPHTVLHIISNPYF